MLRLRGARNSVLAMMKRTRLLHRVALSVAGCFAIACADRHAPDDPTEAGARAADGALDEVIEGYVDLRRGGGGGSVDLSEASFLAAIDADRALLEEARAVRPEGLSLEEDVDRRLLIALLESSVRSAEDRRRWKNDAALYVPSGALGRALDPEATSAPAERAERLAGVLAGLAEWLEQGRLNLDRPPRRFTEAAVFQTESTLGMLRDIGPSLAEEAGEDLDQAVAAGITALEGYLRFLEDDLLPRSDGDWAIGKAEYDFILQHRWFLDADADDILERGRAAFDETVREAQEVADRIAPGQHWVDVYERLKDDHPATDGIKQGYQDQMDAAQRFVIEHEVVSLPDGESVVTIDTPPAMRRSSPFGTFQSVSAFGEGLQGRLVLTPIEDWMTPEQQAERLRSHHTAWLPVIAVHEAYPGHHVQAIKLRENPRILRKVVRESIFSEGWGLFTEELMFELGFLQGDDVRLTVLRNRLWRAARVILDVSLHTGGMSVEDAVDFLVEEVRFERYAAELEVDMYTRRATYVLGYLIGMQEIEAIREDYIEAFGEPSPPSQLYDRLLRIGSIPPALVREELLQGR